MFFFTSYFRSLPDSLVESALVDGASYVKTYFRIMLPMAVPAVITVGVLMFILVWNELLVALLFMPGLDTRTIGVALATLTSQHSTILVRRRRVSRERRADCVGLFLLLALSGDWGDHGGCGVVMPIGARGRGRRGSR